MLVQVLVHLRELHQLLVRLLTVSVRLLQPRVQRLDLVVPALLELSHGCLLLGLQLLQLSSQFVSQVAHLLGVSALLLAQVFLEYLDVLFQGLDLKSQHLFLITRTLAVSLEFFSKFLFVSLQLLVLFSEFSDFFKGLLPELLVLLFLRISIFLAFRQLSSSLIQFISKFLDIPLGLLGSEVIFGASTI